MLADVKPIESVGTPNDIDYEGWFCVKVVRNKCCCGRMVEYVHDDPQGRICVWPEKDHEDILKIAGVIMKHRKELDPHIIEYERSMGPAVPYNKV